VKRSLAFALCFVSGWPSAMTANAAQTPSELRRTAERLLTALQKGDERTILSLMRTPEAFGADGALSKEARSHLFDRPQPYARSIAELARDWGIQVEVRMLANGSAIALFHTWGTKVEYLRDEDYRVSYFACRFHPTPAGWRMQRLCSD
jgi:hypothetical protein